MFRKVFIRVGIILIIFIISIIFLIWKNEKRIVDTLVDKVNTSLVHPIKIESSNLGWLRTFPNLTLLARNVRIPDNTNQTFLAAQKLSINLPLKSLFMDEVNVKSIVIEDALLDITEDPKLGSNYNIFKSTGGSSDRKLFLHKLTLKNVLVNYMDESNGAQVKIQIKTSYNSVSISGDLIQFDTKSNFQSHEITIDSIDYLTNKALKAKGKFQFDNQSKNLNFDNLKIEPASLALTLDGNIQFKREGTNYNLLYRFNKVNIDELIAVIPPTYLSSFTSLPSGGKITINGEIRGLQSSQKNPHIYINYQLSQTSFTYNHFDFEKIYARGSFNNGKSNKISTIGIVIDSLDGKLFDRLIHGSANIHSLSPLRGKGSFTGSIPLVKLNSFITDSILHFKKGILDIRHFEIDNLVAQKLKGFVSAENAEIVYEDSEIVVPILEIELKGDTCFINSLTSTINDQEINVFGHVAHLPLTKTQSTIPSYNISLESQSLDLDKILAVFSQKPVINKKASAANKSPLLNFAQMEGIINHQIEQVVYKEIPLQNLKGKIAIHRNNFLYSEQAKLAEGSISTEGKIINNGKLFADGIFKSQRVDIKTLFKLFNNFSQTFITYKNLSGDLDAEVIYACSWDKEKNIEPESIEAYGKLQILKGGLRDFELLQTFSPYINKEELKSVKFKKMENFFAIKNKHIFFPDMQIQSNAANLTINGAHSFNNQMDYNLKIDAAKVIGNKFGIKRRKPNKEGRINLYYSIYGYPDDLTYDRNKRRVRKSFELTDLLRDDIIKKLNQALR